MELAFLEQQTEQGLENNFLSFMYDQKLYLPAFARRGCPGGKPEELAPHRADVRLNAVGAGGETVAQPLAARLKTVIALSSACWLKGVRKQTPRLATLKSHCPRSGECLIRLKAELCST